MSSADQTNMRLVITSRVDEQPADGTPDKVDVGRLRASFGASPEELEFGVKIVFQLTGNDGAFFLNSENRQQMTATTDVFGICDVQFASTQSGSVTLNAWLEGNGSTSAPPHTFHFTPTSTATPILKINSYPSSLSWPMSGTVSGTLMLGRKGVQTTCRITYTGLLDNTQNSVDTNAQGAFTFQVYAKQSMKSAAGSVTVSYPADPLKNVLASDCKTIQIIAAAESDVQQPRSPDAADD
jgi:hypothetical protein